MRNLSKSGFMGEGTNKVFDPCIIKQVGQNFHIFLEKARPIPTINLTEDEYTISLAG